MIELAPVAKDPLASPWRENAFRVEARTLHASTPHSLDVIGDALASGDAGSILGEFHSMRGRFAGKTAAAAAAPTAISTASTMRTSSPWAAGGAVGSRSSNSLCICPSLSFCLARRPSTRARRNTPHPNEFGRGRCFRVMGTNGERKGRCLPVRPIDRVALTTSFKYRQISADAYVVQR
ncbi:hypothetical protein [Burkholderia ubonensis]|uniref:hypothetical protein n=1 Tax=Burkholderia ubonensis TaxID=101571 RepID=UPI0012FCF955|nr:hypothetical protein [Burkholderia ubonensis]